MTITATFTDNRATIEAGSFRAEITVSQIERNWHALSHYPERRAAIELSDLAARMAGVFAKIADIATQSDLISAEHEAERFARRHVELTRRMWAMESRCMSWFIVGPANFPTARNQKRQNSADKASAAIREHIKATLSSVRRNAWPHGAPGEAIRMSNPDAPALIRAEIAKLQTTHEKMKAANAAIRSAKTTDQETLANAIREATGLPRTVCAQLAVPDCMGVRGFASFNLTNGLAEIRRLEGRLQALEANHARGMVETSHNTNEGELQIIENPNAGRIQLIFPGKPEAKTRDILKANGFRWAPSEGAWQRHLNNAGRYAARQVLDKLQTCEAPAQWTPETARARVGGTFGT
jgi:hypothetical protein